MEDKIMDIISDVTKINKEELMDHKNEARPWDSLIHIELVFALEEEFGIAFEEDELKRLATTAGIIKCVEEKV